MTKRFQWILLALLACGAVLWLVVARIGHESGPSRAESPEKKTGRESSRHRTGEVGNNLPTPLEKKIARLEEELEDKKKVLSELVKTRPQVFPNLGGTQHQEESSEEAEKRAQAAKNFDDARLEVVAAKEELDKLKLELAEEKQNASQDADSN